MSDDVINPSHYKFKTFEAIDVIEEVAGDDYLLGTLLKYSFRFGRKGGLLGRLHDAGKILWFATRIHLREIRRHKEREAIHGTTHPAFPEGGVTYSYYPEGKL